MNILGLFASIARTALGIVGTATTGGTATGIIAALPAIIQLVEKILPKKDNAPTGAMKHDAVVAIVKEMILTAEGISGKEIVDEIAFTNGLNKAIEGIVEVLNATAWKTNPKIL